MTEEADDRRGRYHGHGQYDEIIANLDHRPLEMAPGLRFLNQLRCPPVEGVHPRGNYKCVHLALSNNRGGEGDIALMLLHGQRFPG